LHASQTVSEAVEDIPDGIFARQLAVLPAFLADQCLPHGLRRHPCVAKRGLKLGIDLAVGCHKGSHIFRQLRPFLFGFAIAAGGRIVHPGEAGPQFVQSQDHCAAGPAKHGFCSSSTAVAIVQNPLGLQRPSLGPCQFLGRVLDGGNVRFLQFVHHPLPKTSASVPKPKLGKGNSEREALGS
jgi:hypothetical protein